MVKPYWTNGPSTLYRADARAIPLPDESVHCVVTSPPYFGLRDYGLSNWQGGDAACRHERIAAPGASRVDGNMPANTNHVKQPWPGAVCGHCGAEQTKAGIGLEDTLDEYLAALVEVSREVWRVLRPDGTFWLNLGDSYAGSWGNGLPPKNLLMVPARVAMALQAEGWYLRRDIIWFKPNSMPESVRDRPTGAHEYIWLFSKSGAQIYWTHREQRGSRSKPRPDYRWVDQAAGIEYPEEPDDWSDELIDCPDCQGAGETEIVSGQISMFDGVPAQVIDCGRCNTQDAETPGQIFRWRRLNLWAGHDYFYDAEAVRQPMKGSTFWSQAGGPKDYGQTVNANRSIRKTLETVAKRSGKQRGHGRRHEGFNDRWDAMTKAEQQAVGANLRSVWPIAPQPYGGAHFATFPEDLPETCIQAATSAGGVCAECGAPQVRRVVATGHRNSREPAHQPGNTPSKVDSTGWKPTSKPTDDWAPTCEHDSGPVPAVVLDPFAGSGTTLAVAQRLGRQAYGVDLSSEYLDLAVKRIGKVRASEPAVRV